MLAQVRQQVLPIIKNTVRWWHGLWTTPRFPNRAVFRRSAKQSCGQIGK
jgi:hypothetical protein